MNIDSPLAWKRRRLTNIDPMDAEAARAKLQAAKEKYGREIRVFETLKASQQAAAQAAESGESDDFFEFTAEDYYHLMGAKKEDKFLKTRKIREAEQAARRARMTKAVIRIRFPDDHTLEATFHPSEPLQSVFDLLKILLARPELPFYLYTTPPKKVIKDASQDFFAAGFVPGAIVYFSYEDGGANSGPFLTEELMSLKGLDELVASEPKPEQELTGSVSEGASSAAGAPPVAQEKKPAEKKAIKPKWLKM